MNDREFIELLNLYVDHEIGPADALRLEAEVLRDTERREIYDQYCRMQKACSMLSEEVVEPAPSVIAFPSPPRLGFGSVLGGLAAAAVVALVVADFRGTVAPGPSRAASASTGSPAARPLAAAAPLESDSMKPVFFVRMPSDQMSPRGRQAIFSSIDTSSQMAQLNWIGAVHMTPVFTSPSPGFLLNPKTDLKAAALADPQGVRDDQDQVEMTAFRFQR